MEKQEIDMKANIEEQIRTRAKEIAERSMAWERRKAAEQAKLQESQKMTAGTT